MPANRVNVPFTILESAAYTASNNSADMVNRHCKGVKVFIHCSAIAASPSVVFTIAEKDYLSGEYNAILASAAIVAEGLTVLTVYPGTTVAANVAISQPLPHTWRVQAVHADADSITYSVTGCYIV